MARAEHLRRGAEHEVGFALHLDLLPGLPPAECRQLQRRHEDYAEAQGLHFEGTQLRHVVSAADRPVSAADQVALVDWLVVQCGVVGLRIGPIRPLPEARDDDPAFIQVRSGDLALNGLTLLYRCGRIDPALYLQILGGYVRPAHVH